MRVRVLKLEGGVSPTRPRAFRTNRFGSDLNSSSSVFFLVFLKAVWRTRYQPSGTNEGVCVFHHITPIVQMFSSCYGDEQVGCGIRQQCPVSLFWGGWFLVSGCIQCKVCVCVLENYSLEVDVTVQLCSEQTLPATFQELCHHLRVWGCVCVCPGGGGGGYVVCDGPKNL